MRELILIAHDIRSTHNVGSLLRTAEGLGVRRLIFSGFTPYPAHKDDVRLPHLARKVDQQIAKTALDAEKLVPWEMSTNLEMTIKNLQTDGYTVIALEQANAAVQLYKFQPPEKIAVLLGREVEGIEPKFLKLCDQIVEIPMFGKKESFNVVQAAAMMLYHCRFAEK